MLIILKIIKLNIDRYLKCFYILLDYFKHPLYRYVNQIIKKV